MKEKIIGKFFQKAKKKLGKKNFYKNLEKHCLLSEIKKKPSIVSNDEK